MKQLKVSKFSIFKLKSMRFNVIILHTHVKSKSYGFDAVATDLCVLRHNFVINNALINPTITRNTYKFCK